jgi:hypothetical protein
MIGAFVYGVDLDLDLNIRVDANVKGFAMSGKPGIGSAAVIADADRSHAVDDAEGFAVFLFGHD